MPAIVEPTPSAFAVSSAQIAARAHAIVLEQIEQGAAIFLAEPWRIFRFKGLILSADVPATVDAIRKEAQAEADRVARGHWTADFNRAMALRQLEKATHHPDFAAVYAAAFAEQ